MTLRFLEKNIRVNNINNVKIVNKAVSSKRGRVKLYLADNPYNSSIVFNSNRYVEVETITLDELLSPYDSIDLIKIDVEGAELDVIKSGINQLHKVKKIVMEVRNQYESEIDSTLIKEGFKKCILEDRGHEKNILYYVGE
ncbi:FkbM family methyltransferase [Sulfurisphaera tokodaii]|uniref:FkbM family methyltransferase n=1 Tax=Sulfurisphaera tokodaii TaxID=111955 RepID=A0A832T9X3_9CREN|nr:FkbM family methyltransferase [Sulfurisphaera tokodaii]HII74430.1 FkbM family methyltransferase [Sulfurisphaera tokodaii]